MGCPNYLQYLEPCENIKEEKRKKERKEKREERGRSIVSVNSRPRYLQWFGTIQSILFESKFQNRNFKHENFILFSELFFFFLFFFVFFSHSVPRFLCFLCTILHRDSIRCGLFRV